MFEKSLTDLIRGIRANKKNDQKYIAVCLQEIRQECKSNDPDIKAVAIAKLTYVPIEPKTLQMLGYDMSWASFHIVEVMSSPKFLAKRTGYLAAAQSFQQDTDVLMLTTNLIKKDLGSPNPLDIGITINGLSHILTPDLARDLCQDLVSMLNHSRPYIRKKVVLVLYKVFLKFPEGLRLSFGRLKERLEDPDPYPHDLLQQLDAHQDHQAGLYPPSPFSPPHSFGALTPLEPRLAKKLLPPITTLIQTTPAMSLLYECIYTVITGGFLDAATAADPNQATALAAMCVSKLRKFLEDTDQNCEFVGSIRILGRLTLLALVWATVKYIGLLALGKILPTHPKLVAEHKDLILECIDDPDISIRIRALDLIVGMVNRKNLVDIVKRLMTHLVPPDQDDGSPTTTYPPPSTLLDPVYRADIIHRIIYICSQNAYAYVTNFEWYVAVLVDLTYVAGVSVGDVLTGQIMDVGVRFRILSDVKFLDTATLQDSNTEVLYAAAWICGEYCNYLQNIPATLEFLLQPGVTKLQATAQAVFVQNILKIYAYWASTLVNQWDAEVQSEFVKVTEVLREKVGMFCRSVDLEVQERACNVREILTMTLDLLSSAQSSGLTAAHPILTALPNLFFSYELNPVAPKAQKKVPIPEGLDLDAWINDPLPESGAESEAEVSFGYAYEHDETSRGKKGKKKGRKGKAVDSEEEATSREKRQAERIQRLKHDPYYIADRPTKGSTASLGKQDDFDVDTIPIVKLNLDEIGPGKIVASKKLEIKDSKKKRSLRRTRTPSPPAPIIYAEEEMPEGAAMSASEDEVAPAKKRGSHSAISGKKAKAGILDADTSGLMSIDLSTPLGDDE
ncbi:adaptor-related protein complex 3 delta 1 subunit, partial [Jimgerdemannia flammicorona]